MRTCDDYRQLGYEKLMTELKTMLARCRQITLSLSETERAELQPALEALHSLTAAPGKRTELQSDCQPTFQAACTALGLSASTVRAWRRRTVSEAEVCRRLGEEQRKSHKARTKERDAAALAQLRALVTAIVHGQEDRAERLAFTLQDHYNW